MRGYDDFLAEIRRRKASRWAEILSAEPRGRAPGRRERDPEQERLLLRLDRARLARRDAAGEIRIRKVAPTGSGQGDGA